MVIKYNANENPIYAMAIEDINDLLTDGYEVYRDRLTVPENKPNSIGDTN